MVTYVYGLLICRKARRIIPRSQVWNFVGERRGVHGIYIHAFTTGATITPNGKPACFRILYKVLPVHVCSKIALRQPVIAIPSWHAVVMFQSVPAHYDVET